MITIRDYAKVKGISYEAVRRQVSKYMPELEGHISKQNRTQYLDDAAVEILDGHRNESTIVLQHEDANEEMQRLRDQLATVTNRLVNTQQQVIDLQAKAADLIEYKAKYETMIEHKDETETALKEARESLKTAEDANAAAQREIKSFKKTKFFGLYRKGE